MAADMELDYGEHINPAAAESHWWSSDVHRAIDREWIERAALHYATPNLWSSNPSRSCIVGDTRPAFPWDVDIRSIGPPADDVDIRSIGPPADDVDTVEYLYEMRRIMDDELSRLYQQANAAFLVLKLRLHAIVVLTRLQRARYLNADWHQLIRLEIANTLLERIKGATMTPRDVDERLGRCSVLIAPSEPLCIVPLSLFVGTNDPRLVSSSVTAPPNGANAEMDREFRELARANPDTTLLDTEKGRELIATLQSDLMTTVERHHRKNWLHVDAFIASEYPRVVETTNAQLVRLIMISKVLHAHSLGAAGAKNIDMTYERCHWFFSRDNDPGAMGFKPRERRIVAPSARLLRSAVKLPKPSRDLSM